MKNALLIVALLALIALLHWHDTYTETRIAARTHAERQQAIEAIREIDSGASPVVMAQTPGESE